MSENRMIVIPASLAKRIDDIRGSDSRSDFIIRLIEGNLSNESENQDFATKEEVRILKKRIEEFSKTSPDDYVTQAQLTKFKQSLKELMRTFIDFYINYELRAGSQESVSEINNLVKDLEPKEMGKR